MLTLNKAKQLALQCIARQIGRPAEPRVILDEFTECRRTGWIFHWARHGRRRENAKIVVSHEGEVRHLE